MTVTVWEHPDSTDVTVEPSEACPVPGAKLLLTLVDVPDGCICEETLQNIVKFLADLDAPGH